MQELNFDFKFPFSLLGKAIILALSSGLLSASETTPMIVLFWAKESVVKRSK